MYLQEFMNTVARVDDWLDSDMSPEYSHNPLAHDWARVTKVCAESGEVWDALSLETGENPRKGKTGSEEKTLGELGDVAIAALAGIQHRTKDTTRTWSIVCEAAVKAANRAGEAGH